jgi:hypothetical protein
VASRACGGLERGGESPEGGARPSSEADSCPRERQSLEQGGELLEGYRSRVGWWAVIVSLGRGPSCFGL